MVAFENWVKVRFRTRLKDDREFHSEAMPCFLRSSSVTS